MLNYNIQLNVDKLEDNDYFLVLIHRFNLNKDHYIIQINYELDEFIDDRFQAFYYVKSKIKEIVDYISSHSKESVLGLILLDRILHMIPKHAECIEITLDNLRPQVHENISSDEMDDLSRAFNFSVNEAKEIKELRDNVAQLKDSLHRIVGDYRSNEEWDPFLVNDGEKLFN